MSWAPGPFVVKAARLKGLTGTLSWPSQPDLTFAHELAGRVHVISGWIRLRSFAAERNGPTTKGPSTSHAQGANEAALRKRRRRGSSLGAGKELPKPTMPGSPLRYVDAINGVPNETRQPFEDPDPRDFERRATGRTACIPIRTAHRHASRATAFCGWKPPAWQKDRGAGKPDTLLRSDAAATAHYLIRRGGAGLVERVVPEELRRGSAPGLFVFGERLAAGAARESRWDKSLPHLVRIFPGDRQSARPVRGPGLPDEEDGEAPGESLEQVLENTVSTKTPVIGRRPCYRR